MYQDTYDIELPDKNATIDDFKILEPIWYFEGGISPETTYLGIITGVINDRIIILKYVDKLWRKVEVFPSEISHRSHDFSQELYNMRKINLRIPEVVFEMPEVWYDSLMKSVRG